MATKKSTPVKKKPTKAPVKKPAAIKTKARMKTAHLKLRRDSEDFMTFRVNRETYYWLVLGVTVIMFTMWVLKLQSDIMTAYDQIDANSSSIDDLQAVTKSKQAREQ
jgi:hypothetical protein